MVFISNYQYNNIPYIKRFIDSDNNNKQTVDPYHQIELQQKYNDNSNKLIAAIACGFPIQYSSSPDISHSLSGIQDQQMIQLDEQWLSQQNIDGEWCQICLINERTVREIEITARKSSYFNEFVGLFTIKYTVDGVDWDTYNDGQAIDGPSSAGQTVRHKLIPFRAISVKMYPQNFQKTMSCRWEIYFQKE